MANIVIGMPLVGDVSQEVYEDHMRFCYYLGRRYSDHKFFLAIKLVLFCVKSTFLKVYYSLF